jgi:hypothetical protein
MQSVIVYVTLFCKAFQMVQLELEPMKYVRYLIYMYIAQQKLAWSA